MTLPISSWSCQAICIHLGQLSVSEIGAPQRLGNPVVSVSNIKYIVLEKTNYKIKIPILDIF
jgi:hypothetical protein